MGTRRPWGAASRVRIPTRRSVRGTGDALVHSQPVGPDRKDDCRESCAQRLERYPVVRDELLEPCQSLNPLPAVSSGDSWVDPVALLEGCRRCGRRLRQHTATSEERLATAVDGANRGVLVTPEGCNNGGTIASLILQRRWRSHAEFAPLGRWPIRSKEAAHWSGCFHRRATDLARMAPQAWPSFAALHESSCDRVGQGVGHLLDHIIKFDQSDRAVGP